MSLGGSGWNAPPPPGVKRVRRLRMIGVCIGRLHRLRIAADRLGVAPMGLAGSCDGVRIHRRREELLNFRTWLRLINYSNAAVIELKCDCYAMVWDVMDDAK